MPKPKVRLYIRIRRPDRKYVYADPAVNKNRSLRAEYAIVDGRLEHHPEGVYYLRYARDGKRVWESVGKDADLALVTRLNREHDLQAAALGRIPEPVTPQIETPNQPGTTVEQAIDLYLEEVRGSRASKTIAACEFMLGEFGQRYGSLKIASVTRADLVGHMRHLRARGVSDRTVFNHVARINTLLRLNGIVQILKPSDWPTYDEKIVSAYAPEEIEQLLDAASPEEQFLFTFFLSTGFREQEVMHCTWSDINFRDRIITVRSKPEFGFRPKDKEERRVPVPDELITSLTDRKRTSKSPLVFPGPNGKPNGHFLRKLQRLAFRAGLNCGECTTRAGSSCADKPVCRR